MIKIALMLEASKMSDRDLTTIAMARLGFDGATWFFNLAHVSMAARIA